MRRLLGLAVSLWLLLPAVALAADEASAEEETFVPSVEWNLHTWGPELKLGPIGMSINKAPCSSLINWRRVVV